MVRAAPVPLIIACVPAWGCWRGGMTPRQHPRQETWSNPSSSSSSSSSGSAASLWQQCREPVPCTSRVCAQASGVPGCVPGPGRRRRLVRRLPSHSCSWPLQEQNPFEVAFDLELDKSSDLELDKSNDLEPVSECPSRPGELRVSTQGGALTLDPGMSALCVALKALGGCPGAGDAGGSAGWPGVTHAGGFAPAQMCL